jgi:hypothetical protein
MTTDHRTLDAAPATTPDTPSRSTADCLAPRLRRSVRGTRILPLQTRRSSSFCWRTPVRAAQSTTSASRSRTLRRFTVRSPVCPARGCSRMRRWARPAASRPRTRSGSPAPAVNAGRSTPSSLTASPSARAHRPLSALGSPPTASAAAMTPKLRPAVEPKRPVREYRRSPVRDWKHRRRGRRTRCGFLAAAVVARPSTRR